LGYKKRVNFDANSDPFFGSDFHQIFMQILSTFLAQKFACFLNTLYHCNPTQTVNPNLTPATPAIVANPNLTPALTVQTACLNILLGVV